MKGTGDLGGFSPQRANKNMTNESTGTMLKQAREQRQLTVQQVAEKTKIRSHYLQALENDDFGVMPSSAQARGFLRIYADFLGLDLNQLIASSPTVDSAASTLPSSSVAGADDQDAAPDLKTSPPGPLSFLRDLWARHASGNRAGAFRPDADAGQAAGGIASESLDGESRPQASLGDVDTAKKKGMN